MLSDNLENNSSATISHEKSVAKKVRTGRWTEKQIYLFETLLERYGKNYLKIQEHIKVRSLSQIRSHAQKYFGKIGPKRVEQLQLRAKIIEAYETLNKQKLLKKESQKIFKHQELNNSDKNTKLQIDSEDINKQERSLLRQQNIENKASENINKQDMKEIIINRQQAPVTYFQNFPYFYPHHFGQLGYIWTSPQSLPQTFNQHLDNKMPLEQNYQIK